MQSCLNFKATYITVIIKPEPRISALKDFIQLQSKYRVPSLNKPSTSLCVGGELTDPLPKVPYKHFAFQTTLRSLRPKIQEKKLKNTIST